MGIGVRLREERGRLGLSQEAFGAAGGVRKQAQLLYEKEERKPDSGYLLAIAAAGADVLYVLTGERSDAHPAHNAAEQVLLDSYRRCNTQARQYLIQTAALLTAGVPPGASEGSGMHMSNLGDGNVQVGGSVGGSVRVRRGK